MRLHKRRTLTYNLYFRNMLVARLFPKLAYLFVMACCLSSAFTTDVSRYDILPFTDDIMSPAVIGAGCFTHG